MSIKGRSKYSKETVAEIVELSKVMSHADIGRKLGVSKGSVGTIIYRHKHGLIAKDPADEDYWESRCPITGFKLHTTGKNRETPPNTIKIWQR